ncbi:MAG: hypothetical protein IPI01_15690 [Ignavibacteriae bacterium]|nr:hypothetical protein [Ignavibacteriota bacterium]
MVRTAGFSETVCTVIVLALLCTFSMAAHSSDKNTSARPASTLTNDLYRPFLINNVFNYYGNNGSGSFTPFGKGVGAGEGFELPKGSRSFMVFQDGIVWGGRHKGRTVAKVGGSQYTVTLQAGPLLTNGTAGTDPVPANAADPKHRLYRVRSDVRPDVPFAAVEAMLNAEEMPLIGRYESVSAELLYDGYITDWNEWPAAAGAPFKDVNGNGAYDPTVDVPGQPDADQTLWFVANDMNDSLTQSFAGCPPIGIEMQRTIWGYRCGGVLGNTIFISTVLINKSGAPVDSMYITQWSDPDLGNAGDDHVGCDTTLDIGYAYNGRALDATYGVNVPAAGFAFIQGPMVPGAPTDTALFRSSRRPGFRNLRMSSFVAFVDGFHQFTDPARGREQDLSGID